MFGALNGYDDQKVDTFVPATAKPFVPKEQPATAPSDSRCFSFPDGGWECSKCQNYNFKGRKSCHRCKKPKSNDDAEGKPEHMTLAPAEKQMKKKAKK